MRKALLTTVSIVAAVLATAASTQKIDWRIFAEPFVSVARAQDVNWQ
jgi:hypothetical protein